MASTMLRPGDELDRLRVLEVLGHGARGIVYKAYDPRLDRNVALKLLRNDGDREGLDRARKRLVKEAQAMAQLSHPNVVTVHDVGTVQLDGDVQVFVEMEYVRGASLEERLRRWRADPPPWQQVVELFVAAGEGLAAAHDQGLVHRDFKPANVLVSDAGRVRVTDFGLVRRAGESEPSPSKTPGSPPVALDVPLTQTGAVMGTPAYMAPEQFDGRGDDPRVDQFAFCVALYEALHGRRPFAGDDVVELARAVREDAPLPPPAGSPSVPRFVRRAVRRGLARDPALRHPSMHALVAALRADPRARLRRAASGLGVVAGGSAMAYAVHRWLEPGILVLTVAGSSGPLDRITVELDGRPVALEGTTLDLELSAGEHHVRVEAADHDVYDGRFTLRRGQTWRQEVLLRHATGIVDLDTHPDGARLTLDRQERGSSLHGLEMDTGPHELKVEGPGRHEARLRFDLNRGERLELTAYLAPGVVFEHLGGGLPLGRGPLGDADGDGLGDIWNHEYTTLFAYSPATGALLWSTTTSRNDHADFVRMADLDRDGTLDAILLGADEHGATLRVWSGRPRPDAALRWSAPVDPSARLELPLVPPVVVETEHAPLVIATSLERGSVAAYDGRSGTPRWRREVPSPSFGLVSGSDPAGSWVAVAHAGGVSVFEARSGAPRWHHPVETFDRALVDGLQHQHALMHRGRGHADSWMLAARLDAREGEDLLLPAASDPGGGPLVALAGRDGEVLWSKHRVIPLSVMAAGDLDGDGRDDADVAVSPETATTVKGHAAEQRTLVGGRDGTVLDHRRREQPGHWPCDGPAHLFGVDEQGIYARPVGSARITQRFPGRGGPIISTCSDWDSDGQDDLLLATPRDGLRAFDRSGESIGSVAVPRAIDAIVPLGDVGGDARPDFLLAAGGPTVVAGTRVLWARKFRSTLPAAPVVDDFDGDGQLDVAVFNGQLEESFIELLSAADGRRLRSAPEGRFAIQAPTVVPGLHAGTRDLVFAGPQGSVVRVLGYDFSAHRLDVTPALETYAGIAASEDGRTLWMTSWLEPPHLRGLRATEGEWRPGTGTPGTSPPSSPWQAIAAHSGEQGGAARPRLAPLGSEDALAVVATIDGGRMLVVDADSGACRWSRWIGPRGDDRVRFGPSLIDLDGDGRLEVLASAPGEAPAAASSCEQTRRAPAPSEAPDLTALDGSTGAIRWTVPGAGSPRSPPVSATRGAHRWLVGASETCGLYAVEVDGSARWSRRPSSPPSTPLRVGDLDGDGTPEVVFGDQDGALVVHDAVDGALRWRWSPPRPTRQRAPPVLADLDADGDHEVLLATGAGVLFALDGMFVPTDEREPSTEASRRCGRYDPEPEAP